MGLLDFFNIPGVVDVGIGLSDLEKIIRENYTANKDKDNQNSENKNFEENIGDEKSK